MIGEVALHVASAVGDSCTCRHTLSVALQHGSNQQSGNKKRLFSSTVRVPEGYNALTLTKAFRQMREIEKPSFADDN